jgi:hypothetical protein
MSQYVTTANRREIRTLVRYVGMGGTEEWDSDDDICDEESCWTV